MNYEQLKWQETKNDVTIDCSLDLTVHPAKSNIILLTIPGVDGSVDGYEDKYIQIANKVQAEYGAAVVRMANPFITSFHWESNIRRVLDYIEANRRAIVGSDDYELRIMAHSAGGSIIARLVWEYPRISRLLLINPAMRLGPDEITLGLSRFEGNKLTIVVGGEDPSLVPVLALGKDRSIRAEVIVIENADHNFSSESLVDFLEAPHKHLFS